MLPFSLSANKKSIALVWLHDHVAGKRLQIAILSATSKIRRKG
jgi:hypothetical protein